MDRRASRRAARHSAGGWRSTAALLAGWLLLAAGLTGCTFSVHPVLTKDDLTKDVDLSGTWKLDRPVRGKADPDPHVVTLEGFESNTSYDAELQGLGYEFDVRVGKIGDQRIVQFIRSDLSLAGDGPVLSKLPVYGFARFELKGDELHVFPIDDQEVRKLLGRHDIAFRDYKPSDMLNWCIVSDRTSILQKLIREQGDALFRKQPALFKRTSAGPPSTPPK